MNVDAIREILDQERRDGLLDGGFIDVRRVTTRYSSFDGRRHGVCFSSLSAEDVDAVIAEEVRFLGTLAGDIEWKLYSHDSPPDLLQRLQRIGFLIGDCETVMAIDLTQLPEWLLNSTAHVQRIEDENQLEMFATVAEKLYGDDAWGLVQELAASLATCSNEEFGYVAFAEDTPVAIGRLFARAGSVFAGLYSGGTLPTFRRRGFYRSLIAVRAKDALALGKTYLTVDAMPTSRPILERLGFMRLTDSWPCYLTIASS